MAALQGVPKETLYVETPSVLDASPAVRVRLRDAEKICERAVMIKAEKKENEGISMKF